MKRRGFLLAGPSVAASLALAAWAEGGARGGPAEGSALPVYEDGTARINAWLAARLDVALPPGIYMVRGELNLRDGHVVSPAAGARVVLKAATAYRGRMVAAYDKRITLRGITFDGSYPQRLPSEGSTEASIVHVVGGQVTLEGNTFAYAPSYAVWAWKSPGLQVRGNTFLECWQPIRLDGAGLPSGVIEDNTFTNTAAFRSIQHIDAINTVGLVVRGNTMAGAGLAEPRSHGYEGTWGNSIYLVNSSGYLVEANTVRTNHWSALVSGAGSSHGIIRNNDFSDGTRTSASVWIEQPGASDITVEGNRLDGGISVGDNGGDRLAIVDNTIRTRSVGIDVNSGARTVLIKGNRIASKAGRRFENGIYLWEKKTPGVDVRVVDNAFSGFDKAIAINNSRGLGRVYGIRLNGNRFEDNNAQVWVPGGIVLDQPLGQ